MNHLHLRLVAIVALAATVSAHQHLACVGAPEGEHYFSPSPQTCGNYVLCINGEAHIGECEDGLSFEVAQQGCANPQFVDCTRCGPFGFVKLPHTEDCDKYFECTFGQRKLRTCPEGFLFDRTVGACNNDFMVTTCPGSEGDWDDDGTPGLEPPGDGTDPTGPDGPSGPLPSCETGQVHHAHLTDCNKYFLCVRGNLWEHTCPSELNWNERAMACDLPEHAGCMNMGDGGDWGDGGDGGAGDGGGDQEFPEWGPFSKPGRPGQAKRPGQAGRPGRPARPGQSVARPGQAGKQLVSKRPPVRGTEPIRRLIRPAAGAVKPEN